MVVIQASGPAYRPTSAQAHSFSGARDRAGAELRAAGAGSALRIPRSLRGRGYGRKWLLEGRPSSAPRRCRLGGAAPRLARKSSCRGRRAAGGFHSRPGPGGWQEGGRRATSRRRKPRPRAVSHLGASDRPTAPALRVPPPSSAARLGPRCSGRGAALRRLRAREDPGGRRGPTGRGRGPHLGVRQAQALRTRKEPPHVPLGLRVCHPRAPRLPPGRAA